MVVHGRSFGIVWYMYTSFLRSIKIFTLVIVLLLTALFQHTLINQSRALVLTWAGTAVANVQGCLNHILNLRARASLIALHTLFQLLMEKKKKDRDFTQMASLPLFSPSPLLHLSNTAGPLLQASQWRSCQNLTTRNGKSWSHRYNFPPTTVLDYTSLNAWEEKRRRKMHFKLSSSSPQLLYFSNHLFYDGAAMR